jgi:hypothetical protein
MKVNIQRKLYDTERDDLLGCKSFGEYGDATGYEERLYKTKEGRHYIYYNGGSESPHPVESIKRVKVGEARIWSLASEIGALATSINR